MPKSDVAKLAASFVLLLVAVVLGIRNCGGEGTGEPVTYFYDLSAGQLFTAPQETSFAPIRGIDDEEEDGALAIVVAPPGQCDDEDARRIAYLQIFSPELKAQFEAAQAAEAGGPPAEQRIGRGQASSHTFVKRVEDTEWVPMTSPAAQVILEEWMEPGPDGQTPVVCVP